MGITHCKNCGKEVFHHSGGMCITCYKKLIWKPKKIICKICNKEKFHHTKGMCQNCSNKLLYYDHIKKHNCRKWHNIDLGDYKEITKKCVICGFDKIVDLHHLDHNKENNTKENLIGLCPNHHKLIHMDEYKQDIIRQLKEKGFKTGDTKNEPRVS